METTLFRPDIEATDDESIAGKKASYKLPSKKLTVGRISSVRSSIVGQSKEAKVDKKNPFPSFISSKPTSN